MTSDTALKSILEHEEIEFYKYFKIKKTSNTISEYDNSYAFINRYNNANLTLTLLTSPLDLNSNNLPLTSIFMPLINHIIIKDINDINLMVGDSIDPSKFSSSIYLQFIENGLTSKFKTSNLKPYDLTISKPGFHELILDNSNYNISANIPLIEYSNNIVSEKTLDKYLKDYIMIDSIDELSNILNTQINGFHLWRYFLWILTLLIIMEMIISNIYVYKND